MINGMSPVTVAGTLGCAFAIGFVMQNVQSDVPEPQPTPFAVAHIEQTVLAPAAVLPVRASPTRVRPEALPSMPAEPSTPAIGCPVGLSAQAVEGANVRMSLDAPCRRNSAVEFHHAGMIVSARTDDQGQLNLTLPALLPHAVYIASFEDGAGAVATTSVADLDQVERIVLQWSGKTGLNVHVREFGADYGQSGHLWTGAEPGRAGRGHVQRHGTDVLPANHMAEVYTFPKAQAGGGGIVSLSVEAEVTLDNCGRRIDAQSLELRGDGQLRTRDLPLDMPDCGAVGTFLVLNNLMEDLKIASR